MTEPAADALAAFRQFNFERIYLRPASLRQAERVIGLLRGLVDSYVDVPSRLARGRHRRAPPISSPVRRRPRRSRCATSRG